MSKKILWVLVVAAVAVAGFIGYKFVVNSAQQNQSQQNTQQIIASLTADEFEQKLATGEYVLLDVRTPQEFQEGHIQGAINVDFYQPDFPTKLEQLDKTKKYLVYCRSGNRSRQTIEMMQMMGFKEVYDLLGGIKAWKASGRPVVTQ